MLLREIHHRVKNNMQVVIGLLQFQASTVSSPEIARIVLDTETRIRSMVLIHERLYNSNDFVNIPLESYIRDLIDSLIYTYRTKTAIKFEYNIENIQIESAKADSSGASHHRSCIQFTETRLSRPGYRHDYPVVQPERKQLPDPFYP